MYENSFYQAPAATHPGVQRCGFISIVGRANVGKSTLLNKLIGQKLSITSRKPQTTRNQILGVVTEGDYQAVYLDTPGLQHKKKRLINRLMNRTVHNSLNGGPSVILFLVEANLWTEGDDAVLERLRSTKSLVVLCVNKVDSILDKNSVMLYLSNISKKMDFFDIIPISAKYEKNIHIVRKLVQDHLPKARHHFPEEYVTDRSRVFRVSEIVREKIMRFTGDELPYSAMVEIEKLDYVPSRNLFQIIAIILLDRSSHKKIFIGRRGEKIKTISREARLDLEVLLDKKVYLKTWVKVRPGWTNDEKALKSLGYFNDL